MTGVSPIRPSLFLVVSGPGGTGKTTLVRRMLGNDSTLDYVRNVTTRPRRPPDPISGVDDAEWFDFVSRRQFRELVDVGAFAQWVQPDDGYMSGTPIAPVIEAIAEGRDLVFDYTPQLLINLRQRFAAHIVGVLVVAPTLDEFTRRLERRGGSSRDVELKQRMARQDLGFVAMHDYVVVNDDLDKAVAVLEAILAAERARLPRQLELVRSLLAEAEPTMLQYYDPWGRRLDAIADPDEAL